ncbi:MAG: Imidazole glycerol phosphate synthase amidotransferase subunit (EC [uncultured Sulfurovum sp.]|uniref:Imidazole glycerol phosphate synthase subunit HisH n=1 Tax=uncultured Sulfurovum sp. TaxID=269237 RepID=A0A6S6TY85_9BACT|nr:MAG: Imidazole glycerol phosphate synthase amidotransferase subunit (EC [uncultured Sulfurovum sp.]
MSNVIGIVNYGVAGNIHSVQKAIEKAGGKVKIVNTKEELLAVDKIILPGVGSFRDAMEELHNKELVESLKEVVQEKSILGICLGMQILTSLGFEYGKTAGLGFINAEVKPMLVDAKVPHLGFSSIEVIKSNAILKGLENEEFYFMHSYEVVNYTDIATLTSYANHKFVSSIHKDKVYGVQFHPEKSRDAGIRLFTNFIEL